MEALPISANDPRSALVRNRAMQHQGTPGSPSKCGHIKKMLLLCQGLFAGKIIAPGCEIPHHFYEKEHRSNGRQDKRLLHRTQNNFLKVSCAAHGSRTTAERAFQSAFLLRVLPEWLRFSARPKIRVRNLCGGVFKFTANLRVRRDRNAHGEKLVFFSTRKTCGGAMVVP